ncbi:MAG: hypothetical protein Q7S40_22565, partial [Opitutaceae bacterium]|nr:hypothetical protein [Opitutaceae bacterium]
MAELNEVSFVHGKPGAPITEGLRGGEAVERSGDAAVSTGGTGKLRDLSLASLSFSFVRSREKEKDK